MKRRSNKINKSNSKKSKTSSDDNLTYFNSLPYDLRSELFLLLSYKQVINICNNIECFSFFVNENSTYANKYWKRRLSNVVKVPVNVFQEVSIEYIRKVLSKSKIEQKKHILLYAARYGYFSIIQIFCPLYANDKLISLGNHDYYLHSTYWYYFDTIVTIDFCINIVKQK